MTHRLMGWRAPNHLIRHIRLRHHHGRLFTSTPSSRSDFTHVIIGAGVVGLATAQRLTHLHPTASTLLLEQHPQIGTETSSRNSEVIHAGIYYGPGTLKTDLCIRGRQLLYSFCDERGIGYLKTGKWIVAQDEGQLASLQEIHDLCRGELGVPVRWVGRSEAERLEPDLRAGAGVLESPETGIVDSHGLMVTLLGLFEESGGTVALNSRVEGVETLRKGQGGWELVVRDATTGEASTITADVVVNAAGLGAASVHNMAVADPSRHVPLFYAKGNYFSYSPSGKGKPLRVSRLIYPAPEPGAGGLGTHLTLDLAGRIRFGPDVEWVSSPDYLAPNLARLPEALTAIRKYLPGLDADCLAPDYAGIRPKLGQMGAVAQGKGFQDFVVRREEGVEGWVDLLGIESPGLTSSLAIAERVEALLYNK